MTEGGRAGRPSGLAGFYHSFALRCAGNDRTIRLYIGTRGGNSLPFVGELDDIKITGRALTPVEFMTKRSSPPGVTITIR